MITSRILFAAMLSAGVMACADAGMMSPAPAQMSVLPRYSAGCDPAYPCFENPEDVPGDWTPRILSKSPVVYWNGNTAVGSSWMRYFGNRAEETFELEITGPSSATRTAAGASNGGFLPWNYEHVTPGFTLTASAGSCGHLARLNSQHHAIVTIWHQMWGLQENRVSEPGGDSDPQPACPCSGGGGKGGGELVENRSGAFDTTLPIQVDCTGDGGRGGGGGSGGEGGMMRCYTVTTEHYWYHPDTGVYEYRYTDTNTWCEMIQ